MWGGAPQNLLHLGFNKVKSVGEGIDARYSVNVATSNKRLFVESLTVMTDNIFSPFFPINKIALDKGFMLM